MKNFPKLKEGQVALLRVETNTGHVLDESFLLAINDSQKVFTVFDNLQGALTYANNFLIKTKQFEFSIYDSTQKPIQCLSPYEDK